LSPIKQAGHVSVLVGDKSCREFAPSTVKKPVTEKPFLGGMGTVLGYGLIPWLTAHSHGDKWAKSRCDAERLRSQKDSGYFFFAVGPCIGTGIGAGGLPGVGMGDLDGAEVIVLWYPPQPDTIHKTASTKPVSVPCQT
jgi:hypothetical protein